MLARCWRPTQRFSRSYCTASQNVLFSTENKIGRIVLNNPGKRNCLSRPTLASLHHILTSGVIPDSTEIVLLSSVGPVFSSGHDLADFNGTSREYQSEIIELCGTVNVAIRKLPQPVVAVVNGLATAAGCQLASTCDLLFASHTSQFSAPGVLGGRFCHTPGVAIADKINRKALQMLLLGDTLTAEEAYQFGLVNRLFRPETIDREVDELIQKLVKTGGRNLREGKACFYEQTSQPSLEGKYKVANGYMLNMFQSEACQESIKHFFESKKKK